MVSMEQRLSSTHQQLWVHSGMQSSTSVSDDPYLLVTILTCAMELVKVVAVSAKATRYPAYVPHVSSLPYFSEPMWPIEARNAAIANTYFVGCINRVGTVSGVHINPVTVYYVQCMSCELLHVTFMCKCA